MWHQNFVTLDTETTGFDGSARIIELGMVWFHDGRVRDVLDVRFYPEGLDWESSAVKQAEATHHITRAELEGCPSFASHVEVVEQMMKRAPFIVAHNAEFDLRMVQQEFNRLGRPLQPIRAICTLKLDRQLSPGKHKLADSCRRWGVDLKDAHSALGDAKACGELLLAMWKSGRLPAQL